MNKICASHSKSPISIETLLDIPEVVLIKNGKTAAELPALDTTLKEIIVDASCGAAVLRGAHIFAPGVIGMLSGTKSGEIVNVFADIQGTCKKGTNRLHDSDQKQFLGIGIVKMQRYQLFNTSSSPSGIAIEMMETVSTVPSIGDVFSTIDLGLLQNLPSIICGRVLNPQENDKILDMCAAPGNKTTHLAELMHDNGCIIALDKSPNRVKLLKSNVEQHRASSIRCFAFDAVKAVVDIGLVLSAVLADGPPFAEASFDKILLDAPCSGFGNRPFLASSMSSKEQSSYPILQKKLFGTSVRLLKSGGELVYSTCTIFESENEEIVQWALGKYENEIELVPAVPYFGGPGWPNVGLAESQRYFSLLLFFIWVLS